VRVKTAETPLAANPLRGAFTAPDTFDPAALPTLMRKLWAHTQR